MTSENFAKQVFINCPFDDDYAHLLQYAIFCICIFGLKPRLATESIDGGQNRLEKIVSLIKDCRYSVHDLSLCRSSKADEVFRMNMPFEYGVDHGLRFSGDETFATKRFIIFERERYDLKRAISDIAGQDVAHHSNDHEKLIEELRDFIRVEAGLRLPSVSAIIGQRTSFNAWIIEKKMHEGHSEKRAMNLPAAEMIEDLQEWIASGKLDTFEPPAT